MGHQTSVPGSGVCLQYDQQDREKAFRTNTHPSVFVTTQQTLFTGIGPRTKIKFTQLPQILQPRHVWGLILAPSFVLKLQVLKLINNGSLFHLKVGLAGLGHSVACCNV